MPVAVLSTCVIDDCDGSPQARGMCPAHYQRWRKHGDPLVFGAVTRYGKPTADGTCSVDGCEREFYGRGWCVTHYARWRRWGDPMASSLNRENDGTCSVEGCPRPYDARGLCSTHFKQARYAEDPTLALAAGHRRRAKERAAVSFKITKRDWARIHGAPCLACGSRDRLQIEHLIPIDRGGSHGVGNIATLCHACNASKRNQTWMEWRVSGKPRAVMVFRRDAT